MRRAAALWGAGELDEPTFREFHDPAKARADELGPAGRLARR